MIQPEITKKSTVKTILINFLIIIIPFGIIYVIVMAIIELTKTKMPIYEQEPIRVRDRRCNVGYRIDGWKKKKTGKKRELSIEEISASRFNGKLRVIALVLFFVVGGILYYFDVNK
jgi:hypothetical protein